MKDYTVMQADALDYRIKSFAQRFVQRVKAYPQGACPLSMVQALLALSRNQSCGKCVPCSDGLDQLQTLVTRVIAGGATMDTLTQIRTLATMIRDTADCAIGYTAADMVLQSLDEFKADYESHVKEKQCLPEVIHKIPCVHRCPAHVDIPAYIALTAAGRYADAVNVIRKDNPFPTACALICEHPCEDMCRRNLIDSEINIRGIKGYAVDHARADQVPLPKPNVPTGRNIAIVGGGPSGLTAAYFLALMGHHIVVFEGRKQLGGMLRYGIPNYRFPKDRLDEDINAILGAGDIEVKLNVQIDKEMMDQLYADYDAVYVAIGAQAGKGLRLDGVKSEGVFNAVDMLGEIGDGLIPDYTGKNVIVVGGGNVAMDCARTSVRANAKSVSIVYRRRQADMTALPSEVQGAMEEGVELVTMTAPASIEVDESGHCTALIAKPQKTGPYDKGGRPACLDADKPPVRIPADIILIATGQDIVSAPFEEFGMPAKWNCFLTDETGAVAEKPGVWSGGDCVSGPSTVIKAIEAGKTAAWNIDAYLGYHHKINFDIAVPEPGPNNRVPTGRVAITERPASERKHDFEGVEICMSEEEVIQECGRCLRCDHYGCGELEGDRD